MLRHQRLDQTSVKERVGWCKRTLTVSLFSVFIAGLDPCKVLYLADKVSFYMQQLSRALRSIKPKPAGLDWWIKLIILERERQSERELQTFA